MANRFARHSLRDEAQAFSQRSNAEQGESKHPPLRGEEQGEGKGGVEWRRAGVQFTFLTVLICSSACSHQWISSVCPFRFTLEREKWSAVEYDVVLHSITSIEEGRMNRQCTVTPTIRLHSSWTRMKKKWNIRHFISSLER